MKQLVVEKNNPDPILLDTPIPKPGPGEVLIRNHYSVVSSGTELAAIEFANTGVSEKLQNSSNIEKGLKLLKHWSKQDLLAAFRPFDSNWENKIISRGKKLFKQTLKLLIN